MLGGYEGFPGQHIGEHRGDREAYASLTSTLAVIGPVEFRLTGAAGKAANGGPALPDGRWEVGARTGLGVKTPIGSIRVEYGRARGGRDAMFVRLGEWF
jgi:outer membrane translocation and assembly module TamA